ncbi:MAG: 4Fe-4S dicluster domain-containing protein [Thermodesulfobacteriota bacterium]
MTDNMDENRYRQLFFDITDAHKIRTCIQCGTCSGSCPLSNHMDHAPRELFALIRDGEMTAVLKSNTPWYCVSCYQCMVRCPREIPVTDLMYALKRMALETGHAPGSSKMPDFYDAFRGLVEKQGRITETLVMARYGLRHPGDALRQIPLALRLLRRKRLELLPQQVRIATRFSRFLTAVSGRREKQ